MYVIGTAGHVDHGKSTLVKALTGIDPDRLEEEKRREMTIDLGFAWVKLPGGNEISIVDVPGHERFIKNMLAGVGGFDAALLVIAADEGVMPQTLEHIDILKLLQIDQGVIALTKCDMVDDEWRNLMVEEVRDKLKEHGSPLHNAPLVPVSARAGTGLKELLATIDSTLKQTPTRLDIGRPRLPIDRVFSIKGFGTVVTGTLVEGTLNVGMEVEIQPGNLKSRIRSLQMHNASTDSAPPGNRVAVNLTGLEVDDLHRGMVLTVPGWLEATDRLDLRVSVLADSPVALAQNSKWDFFSGTAETPVGITVLDAPKLTPGESGLLQVRLTEPVATAKGDRFILRLPSPSQTVAGGIIIDPNPPRHRRFQPEVIENLKTLEKGTPAEIVLQQLATSLPTDLTALAQATRFNPAEVQAAVKELLKEGTALLLDDSATSKLQALQEGQKLDLPGTTVVVARASWQKLQTLSVAVIKQFHAQFPLKLGMGREELKSKLGLPTPRLTNLVVTRLLQEQTLKEQKAQATPGAVLSLLNFEVRLNPAQQKHADMLLVAFDRTPFTPPSLNDLNADLNIMAALIDAGKIKKLNESVYFQSAAYDEMVKGVLDILEKNGQLTLAEVRDRFNASRKPVQALLEYLDDQKITRRTGDVRVKW